MGGDDHRQIVIGRFRGAVLDRDHLKAKLLTESVHRARDRRIADDQDAGRRQHRLEEDLDRAARQARVLDGHGALLGRERLGLDDLSLAIGHLALGRVGQDLQEHRLTRLDRLQRVHAHAVLGTDAAHESLDRAVAEHECDITRTRARRALRAHDGGGHERDAASSEARRDISRLIIAAARGVPASRPTRAPGCRACRRGRRRGSRAARRSPR